MLFGVAYAVFAVLTFLGASFLISFPTATTLSSSLVHFSHSLILFLSHLSHCPSSLQNLSVLLFCLSWIYVFVPSYFPSLFSVIATLTCVQPYSRDRVSSVNSVLLMSVNVCLTPLLCVTGHAFVLASKEPPRRHIYTYRHTHNCPHTKSANLWNIGMCLQSTHMCLLMQPLTCWHSHTENIHPHTNTHTQGVTPAMSGEWREPNTLWSFELY